MPRRLFLPVIVVGELYYGAHKSSRVAENLVRTEEFSGSIAVLGCDETTAEEYGRIKAALKAKGRPIPDNDIWIAAIAKQHSLVLATRDQHFSEVEGLLTESW
jgi:tRNA(fMet)-specific endonuclease VapC